MTTVVDNLLALAALATLLAILAVGQAQAQSFARTRAMEAAEEARALATPVVPACEGDPLDLAGPLPVVRVESTPIFDSLMGGRWRLTLAA